MVVQNPASVSEGTERRLGLGTGKGELKESGSRRRGGSAGAGMEPLVTGVGEAMGDSDTTESGVSALSSRRASRRGARPRKSWGRSRRRSLGQESPSSGVSSPRFKASKSGVSVPEGTDAWVLVQGGFVYVTTKDHEGDLEL